MTAGRDGHGPFPELEGLTVLDKDELELPSAPVGEGAAALAEIRQDAPAGPPPPGAIPSEVSLRLLASVGIEATLFESPARLRLEVEDGRSLSVQCPNGDFGVFRQPDVPEVVDLILSRGPFLIESELLVEQVGSEGRRVLRVQRLGSRSLTEELVLQPPFQEWLDTCTDAWMRDEVAGRATRPDAWQQVAAVGLLTRLREDARAASTEAGPPSMRPEALAVRQWFRALDPELWKDVELLLKAELTLLEADLDDLRSDMEPTDPHWLRHLGRFLAGRDDVEGVRVLLLDAWRVHSARSFEPTAERPALALVSEFDQAARPFIRMLPRLPPTDDERLRRVRRHDPAAWWAWPSDD